MGDVLLLAKYNPDAARKTADAFGWFAVAMYAFSIYHRAQVLTYIQVPFGLELVKGFRKQFLVEYDILIKGQHNRNVAS